MKMTICDVCHYQEKKTTVATHVISHESNMQKLRLDVCQEHKDYFKGSNFDQNVEKVRALMSKKEVPT